MLTDFNGRNSSCFSQIVWVRISDWDITLSSNLVSLVLMSAGCGKKLVGISFIRKSECRRTKIKSITRWIKECELLIYSHLFLSPQLEWVRFASIYLRFERNRHLMCISHWFWWMWWLGNDVKTIRISTLERCKYKVSWKLWRSVSPLILSSISLDSKNQAKTNNLKEKKKNSYLPCNIFINWFVGPLDRIRTKFKSAM